MKAAYYYGNGQIEIQEDKNIEVGPHQVKLKIRYVGICGSDVHIAKGHMDQRIAQNGFPRIFGHEASAVIDEIGSEVTNWKVGDRVVVYAMRGCGECEYCRNDNANVCLDVKSIGIDCDGAFREYWTVDEDVLFKTPDSISDQVAALVEPLAVGVHAVNRSKAKEGDKAIIIGGGPIGLLTALVLKNKNVDVTVSEISQARLDNCRKLGIKTINPNKEDLIAYVNQSSNDKGVDMVFEASGSQQGLDTAPAIIRPNGQTITVATYSQPMQMTISAYHFTQISITPTRPYQHRD